MKRLQHMTQHVINYPVRKYHTFQDFRSRRTRDEHIAWSLNPWARLHLSLQLGYKLCLAAVVSAWLLCMIFAIWVGVNHKAEPGLVYALQTGSCTTTRSTNFWIHLFINILASSLYAVSSFVMQRLVAPTREDIDKAHKTTHQLKIGSLALKNLALLGNKRLPAFILLWASSLPIHLLFNSLIVYTSTNAEWPSYVTMLRDTQLDSFKSNRSILAVPEKRQFGEILNFGVLIPESQLEIQYLLHQAPPLVDLALTDCIETFGSGSSETWGDVFLVYKDDSDAPPDGEVGIFILKEPPVAYGSYLPKVSTDPWNWMCEGYSTGTSICDTQKILSNDMWVVHENIVTRCLARQLPDRCELNTSLAIMIIVLLCISCKLASIVFAVFIGRNQSLLTIGDAVASFLQSPDPASKNQVFYNKIGLAYYHIRRLSYVNRRRMIMLEVARAFWAAAIVGVAGISLAWWWFAYTFRQTRTAFENSKTNFDFGTMLRFGFGEMPTMWTDDLERHILSYGDAQNQSLNFTSGATLANLPQLALSLYYLLFNNYITRLFVALEFRSFSTRRRGLRVTKPSKGTKQRRAHFLQIPLRYSLLNMAIFALLHTFLSQTLFLRRVYAIYPQSFDDPEDIGKKLLPMIGYSPVSGFAFAILLTVLVVLGIGVGFITVDWRFPDTTGSSFNIGAFCRPPEGTENTEEGEVRWGVTNRNAEGMVKCSFSLLPVRPPEVGEVITNSLKS